MNERIKNGSGLQEDSQNSQASIGGPRTTDKGSKRIVALAKDFVKNHGTDLEIRVLSSKCAGDDKPNGYFN